MLKSRVHRYASAGFTAGILLLCAASARAQSSDPASAGRTIASTEGPKVVVVEFVTKITVSMPGSESQDQERKSEVSGTLIDPTGLTVVSLASIDPSAMIGSLMGSGMSVRSDVTEVKIRLADGQEIPGKLVLRDKDQDLAFIRPQKKLAAPIAAFDLKGSATVDVLDQILVLSRMGKVVNRSLSTRIDRVIGVMDKPRKRYILNNQAAAPYELGAPVLSMDGKIIGLVVLKAIRDTTGDGDMSNNVTPVIVPSSDVLTVAAQAPEDAPKEATPAAASPKPAAAPKPAAVPKPAPKPAPKK